MCYTHYGNWVRNGAISIAQWGLLSDCYKVNPIGQRGKILVIVMGFVDTLGQGLIQKKPCTKVQLARTIRLECTKVATRAYILRGILIWSLSRKRPRLDWEV